MGNCKETVLVNKRVCLSSYPKGGLEEGNLVVKEEKACLALNPGSKDVLLKTLWVSVDPYLRLRMLQSAGGRYLPTFQIGEPLATTTLCRVMGSENEGFKEGDMVVGFLEIAEYVVAARGEGIQKVDPLPGIPDSYHLGVLGWSGFTAWVGLNVIGEMKKGDEVYISSAAGAVGIVAGQLAKIKGCRVVGSAGSDNKVRMLKDEFGFDDAFNYKKEKDLVATLGKYFPNGIDVYFENVGGSMLEAVLQHINKNGRIPVCGMVSQYNQEWTQREGVRNLFNLVGCYVKMQGFLAWNHMENWPTFTQKVSTFIREGTLKYNEHIFKGIESFPSALMALFNGENIGKTLVQFGI